MNLICYVKCCERTSHRLLHFILRKCKRPKSDCIPTYSNEMWLHVPKFLISHFMKYLNVIAFKSIESYVHHCSNSVNILSYLNILSFFPSLIWMQFCEFTTWFFTKMTANLFVIRLNETLVTAWCTDDPFEMHENIYRDLYGLPFVRSFIRWMNTTLFGFHWSNKHVVSHRDTNHVQH